MRIGSLRIYEWDTPASSYSEEREGRHCIGKHIYAKGFYTYNGIEGYSFFVAKNHLVMTTLREFRDGKWRTWMVDSPPDYRAMQKYAESAYGDVLTTGLGLGLVVHELCKNVKVKSITVIEQSSEVISLVQKYLPEDSRIRIICGDFWEFIKSDSSKWDSIIVDLWVFIGNEEQLGLYQRELIPANELLKAKYPEAQIVFHGFAGMPTLEEVHKTMRGTGHANELIYGLGS